MELAIGIGVVVCATLLIDRLMVTLGRRGIVYWRNNPVPREHASAAFGELIDYGQPTYRVITEQRRADDAGTGIRGAGPTRSESGRHGR